MRDKLEEFKELNKNKKEVAEHAQNVINKLELKKNRIVRRMYKNVYRLKKAFPTIDTKEITEILNKKIEIIKKNKKENTGEK